MKNKQRAIYTENTQCRDCYKCVRACPVKAIRVKNSSAVVDHDLCIFCGKCVDICPASAKKVRNDIHRADKLIAEKKHVIVSLAPSFTAWFRGNKEDIIAKFKDKGVAEVSETALGAEIVADSENRIYESTRKGTISSACPVIVQLVIQYYPEFADNLSTLHSPMCAHAKYLRALNKDDDIGIIFAGPCIAKKEEADQNSDLIDVALTFEELEVWLNSNNAVEKTCYNKELKFYPCESGNSSLFPIDGGMIATMAAANKTLSTGYITQSGVVSIIEELNSFKKNGELPEIFYEYLACQGGCINGPAIPKKISTAEKRISVISYTKEYENSHISCDSFDIVNHNRKISEVKPACDDEMIIENALAELGKADQADRKDCGGCGYNTCRDFACAFIEGKAEKEMCVTEMRKLAQKKANVLMTTIPLGVAIVDTDLSIVECNRQFLEVFSDIPSEITDEMLIAVRGIPFADFSTERIFYPQDEQKQKQHMTIEHKGTVISCRSFVIQKGLLFGALFQDITSPSIHRETIIRKAEDVIRKNLESTQKIAGLLGENAAETEIILKSLIDAFDTRKNQGVD